jgi:hypothetical protein
VVSCANTRQGMGCASRAESGVVSMRRRDMAADSRDVCDVAVLRHVSALARCRGGVAANEVDESHKRLCTRYEEEALRMCPRGSLAVTGVNAS